MLGSSGSPQPRLLANRGLRHRELPRDQPQQPSDRPRKMQACPRGAVCAAPPKPLPHTLPRQGAQRGTAAAQLAARRPLEGCTWRPCGCSPSSPPPASPCTSGRWDPTGFCWTGASPVDRRLLAHGGGAAWAVTWATLNRNPPGELRQSSHYSRSLSCAAPQCLPAFHPARHGMFRWLQDERWLF